MEITDERFSFILSQTEFDNLRDNAPTLLQQICEYGYYEKTDGNYHFYNQPGNAKLSVKYFLNGDNRSEFLDE